MKSIASPDSLGAVISICPLREESPQAQSRHGYSGEFQTILDGFAEEDYFEEVTHTTTEKKRRLTSDQVKALEKNFEVENKLEPERKSKLAEELGLQPRQVAIWFQNRRARWKTKQLEKDYGVLKANYDALKHDYSTLELEKEALAAKLKELKSKLKEEYAERQERQIFSQENKDHGFRIGKEESNMNGKPQKLMLPASSSSLYFNGSSSSSHPWMEQLPLPNSRMILGNPNHPHLVKMEEQSVFAAEESCNFFSVDQAPSLQWYFTGQ